MVDRVAWPEGEAPLRTLRDFAHYRDTYQRVNGLWKIHYFYIDALTGAGQLSRDSDGNWKSLHV
jgi:hypothetical protein